MLLPQVIIPETLQIQEKYAIGAGGKTYTGIIYIDIYMCDNVDNCTNEILK